MNFNPELKPQGTRHWEANARSYLCNHKTRPGWQYWKFHNTIHNMKSQHEHGVTSMQHHATQHAQPVASCHVMINRKHACMVLQKLLALLCTHKSQVFDPNPRACVGHFGCFRSDSTNNSRPWNRIRHSSVVFWAWWNGPLDPRLYLRKASEIYCDSCCQCMNLGEKFSNAAWFLSSSSTTWHSHVLQKRNRAHDHWKKSCESSTWGISQVWPFPVHPFPLSNFKIAYPPSLKAPKATQVQHVHKWRGSTHEVAMFCFIIYSAFNGSGSVTARHA